MSFARTIPAVKDLEETIDRWHRTGIFDQEPSPTGMPGDTWADRGKRNDVNEVVKRRICRKLSGQLRRPFIVRAQIRYQRSADVNVSAVYYRFPKRASLRPIEAVFRLATKFEVTLHRAYFAMHQLAQSGTQGVVSSDHHSFTEFYVVGEELQQSFAELMASDIGRKALKLDT